MITPRPRRALFVILLLGAFAPTPSRADGVPRDECFPIERLDPALRPKAEALILKMLDSEALYTIVGGLKPVSSSFWRTRFPVDSPELTQLDEARRMLSAVRCGDAYYADVLVFKEAYQGKRHAHAWVAHRPTVRRAIAAHAGFFAPYGVTPESHPLEAVLKAEHAPKSDRLRGAGYLFGYPDYAVDFFVRSDEQRSASPGEKLVPRDFYSVPTFAAEKHKFVWAVPKGYQEAEEDTEIRRRAEAILAEYRRRRAAYVGVGKPGVVALLRDWFDDGYGRCAPENARVSPPAEVLAAVSAPAPAVARAALPVTPAPAAWQVSIARPPVVWACPAAPPTGMAGFSQRRTFRRSPRGWTRWQANRGAAVTRAHR